MGRRARVLAFVSVAVLSGGCAASTSTTGDDDAGVSDDFDASAQRDSNIPPADALVLADDGVDDAATLGKSCQLAADGTPCGAAPDLCHDAPVCMGGVCAPAAARADGTPCGAAPDVCHDAPICRGGACTPVTKPNGTVCAKAPDACHTDGTCQNGSCGSVGVRPEGYQWDPNDTYARCCGGAAIHTTTNADCGVCGIKCNANNGESCGLFNGHYYCLGCVASASCWSGCCSTSFGTPYRCSASVCSSGSCNNTICPNGSHCVPGGGTTSDYCSY